MQVIVSIGSNMDQEKNIDLALNLLNKTFGFLSISPIYKSPPQNNTYYLNLIIQFHTNQNVTACYNALKMIEDTLGREHDTENVSIDLDLLIAGDHLFDTPFPLPHPDILLCDYVLRPLADLLPQQRHPESQQTYQQHWQNFSEPSSLIPIDFIWQEEVISTSPTCIQL